MYEADGHFRLIIPQDEEWGEHPASGLTRMASFGWAPGKGVHRLRRKS